MFAGQLSHLALPFQAPFTTPVVANVPYVPVPQYNALAVLGVPCDAAAVYLQVVSIAPTRVAP